MTTKCNGEHLEVHPLGQREVRADCGDGTITSDGGGLLLGEVEKQTGIIERFDWASVGSFKTACVIPALKKMLAAFDGKDSPSENVLKGLTRILESRSGRWRKTDESTR